MVEDNNAKIKNNETNINESPREKIEVLDSSDVEIIAPETPFDTEKFSDTIKDELAGETPPQGNPYENQSNPYENQSNPYENQSNPYESPSTESRRYGGESFDDGSYVPGLKRINKHLFVWLCTFLLCPIGIDRFVRGQFFLGLLKIITGGLGGLWYVVDFLVAFYKAYLGPYAGQKDFQFFFGHWTR